MDSLKTINEDQGNTVTIFRVVDHIPTMLTVATVKKIEMRTPVHQRVVKTSTLKMMKYWPYLKL